MNRPEAIVERAYAKVNLVLRVGAPRADGMHPLCSLFAALDLADEVVVAPLEAPGSVAVGDATGRDEVVCPGVDGYNLASAAIEALRATPAGVDLPPLRVDIRKRIPVAAGLGGGSADAAAVLRAANALAGSPLDPPALRRLAERLGSDVPSQVEPGHALVSGYGEQVERVDLAPMALVLVPQDEGLSTAAVYAELDRLGGYAASLDDAPLRSLAGAPPAELAAGLANDLEQAALSLRPELAEPPAALRDAGALAAQVTGSGPTTFGVFAERAVAEDAAARVPGAIVTELLG